MIGTRKIWGGRYYAPQVGVVVIRQSHGVALLHPIIFSSITTEIQATFFRKQSEAQEEEAEAATARLNAGRRNDDPLRQERDPSSAVILR